MGLPALMLLASMTGFGSLARESGLTLGMAVATTMGVWGLPGQIALAELYAAGSDVLVVILAVSLANARFLPMTLSLVPLLQLGMRRRWPLYAMLQFISINTWAAAHRVCPGLPGADRRRYFLVFASICMTAAIIGTVIGFSATRSLPPAVTLGLLFLNPVFFALIIAAPRHRASLLALLVGAGLGPPLHLLSADWGLLATGLVGGTAAFWLARVLPRRAGSA